MGAFNAWWADLQPLNQWFFIGAAFFSVFFVWQLIAAIMGLGGGDEGIDTHVDAPDVHHAAEGAQETVEAFRLLSVRSILAFFTLFTWGAALYMSRGMPVGKALILGVLWGLAAMVLVSLVLFAMRKMTSSGNLKIETCVGQTCSVYLDIPQGGVGEVRVLCSGTLTHFKARAVGGVALKAGTMVKVVRVAGPDVIEVEAETASAK